MNLVGMYKCPQCGKEFDKCKPSGPERIFAVCFKCDLVVYIEDFDSWKRKMDAYKTRRMARNVKFGGVVTAKKTYNYFEQFKKSKKEEKPFNPTER